MSYGLLKRAKLDGKAKEILKIEALEREMADLDEVMRLKESISLIHLEMEILKKCYQEVK